MTPEAEKIKQGCGKNINVTIWLSKNRSKLDLSQCGKNKHYCEVCQARLEGFQAGENSKHKSDLQQELEFLKNILFHSLSDVTKMKIKKRINLIEKELKEIEI